MSTAVGLSEGVEYITVGVYVTVVRCKRSSAG